jgi:hypothetical protein
MSETVEIPIDEEAYHELEKLSQATGKTMDELTDELTDYILKIITKTPQGDTLKLYVDGACAHTAS